MLGYTLIIATSLFLNSPTGEAIRCYHCYDAFDVAPVAENLNATYLSSTFVRCDKNKNKWNSWECPVHWPTCVVMAARVKNHYEVVRSCAKKDFCSQYEPPAGVDMDYCQECNTSLCNDYPKLPDPPVGPGPLFTFNVNINLNLKKIPQEQRQKS